jgi:hypothetical protein
MVSKAEEQAKETPASDGRTDKEKMADIGLSPEEQAALEGGDTDEAGKDADADADAGKEADDATKGKDAADDKAAADKEADAAAAGEPGPAETVPDHFTPLAETLNEDDLKQIDNDLVALKTKFDDGDIDYEEYTDQRLEIEKIVWHHEQAEMNNANAVEQRWQWERDWYLQSNAELNQSQVIYGAFASQVNALLADDDWNTAPGFDLLSEAHRRVSSEIDSLAGPGSEPINNGRPAGGDKRSADDKAADALKKAKAAESGKRPPDTLAGKPAAAANTDESKFAYLDNLDGEKLQAAVDKLSPADLKEYEDHH